MFCTIGSVKSTDPIQEACPIDHAGYAASTRWHELNHTDHIHHTDQEYIIFPEIFRLSSGRSIICQKCGTVTLAETTTQWPFRSMKNPAFVDVRAAAPSHLHSEVRTGGHRGHAHRCALPSFYYSSVWVVLRQRFSHVCILYIRYIYEVWVWVRER